MLEENIHDGSVILDEAERATLRKVLVIDQFDQWANPDPVSCSSMLTCAYTRIDEPVG